MPNVVVSSSDDNYLPLAKGFWLSVRDVPHDLTFVDFGNSDATRAWLSDQMPRVQIRSIPDAIDRHITALSSSFYHRALLLRGYLPEIVGGDAIAWVDTDAWVQQSETLDLFLGVAHARRDSFVATAIHDRAYYPLFEFPRAFVNDNILPVYRTFYGDEVADEFAWKPLLACGLFAMHSSSPLWGEWSTEMGRLFSMRDVPMKFLHVAEQTAVNFVAYTSGRYVALSARHSFYSHFGHVIRDETGTVVIDEPEHRPVGVIQLTGLTDGYAQRYLDEGILFQSGRYLSESEADALRRIERSE